MIERARIRATEHAREAIDELWETLIREDLLPRARRYVSSPWRPQLHRAAIHLLRYFARINDPPVYAGIRKRNRQESTRALDRWLASDSRTETDGLAYIPERKSAI